jgi:hypothetical protein
MKQRVLVTLTVIIGLLGLIGGFVAYVDPYQQYTAHDTYLGNQRLEIGGVAKHHSYDAFITGSSMAMNHYPEQADSLWGWHTKNFSIMGATDDDYAVMLPFIIRQGKTKHVIWDMDFFSFARQRGAVNNYLYDNNYWNDYEYLWNYTSLKNSIVYLCHPAPEEGLYHFHSPTGRNCLLKDFQEHTAGYPEEDFDYDLMVERFKASVLPTIYASDSIQLMIYFPPYSIGEFLIYQHSGVLESILKFKQYIIETLSSCRNVALYDFQCAPWVTDLNQYMDVRHHSHAYNRGIIQSIHEDKYRIVSYQDDSLRTLIAAYRDSFPTLDETSPLPTGQPE